MKLNTVEELIEDIPVMAFETSAALAYGPIRCCLMTLFIY